jgi:hypothetical protein
VSSSTFLSLFSAEYSIFLLSNLFQWRTFKWQHVQELTSIFQLRVISVNSIFEIRHWDSIISSFSQ